MILFGLFLLIWFGLGFLGIMHCKDSKVNWHMLIFMALVPFIPLVAKVCGML